MKTSATFEIPADVPLNRPLARMYGLSLPDGVIDVSVQDINGRRCVTLLTAGNSVHAELRAEGRPVPFERSSNTGYRANAPHTAFTVVIAGVGSSNPRASHVRHLARPIAA